MMKNLRSINTAVVLLLISSPAYPQLTIDMAAIKCDQYLAMTPVMSRDFSAWMSGWFSYQTRRTSVDLLLHQRNIAAVKEWCVYHPGESVMSGLKLAITPQ